MDNIILLLNNFPPESRRKTLDNLKYTIPTLWVLDEIHWSYVEISLLLQWMVQLYINTKVNVVDKYVYSLSDNSITLRKIKECTGFRYTDRKRAYRDEMIIQFLIRNEYVYEQRFQKSHNPKQLTELGEKYRIIIQKMNTLPINEINYQIEMDKLLDDVLIKMNSNVWICLPLSYYAVVYLSKYITLK